MIQESEEQYPPTSPVRRWHGDEMDVEIEEPSTTLNSRQAHKVNADDDFIMKSSEGNVDYFEFRSTTGSCDSYQLHPA